MRHQIQAVAFILFSLLWFACGKSANKDNEGDMQTKPPKTEFLEEGIGDPNNDILFPMRTGSVWWNFEGQLLGHVGRPIEIDGKAAMPLYSYRQVDWYYADEDGLFYMGNSRGRLKKRPILWVPNRVKIGMKWHSWTAEDDPQVESEVVGVSMEDTPFGNLPVWHIRREDLVYGTYTSSYYAEGRGPTGGPGDYTQYGAIIPLEDTAMQPPNKIPLAPLNDGEPIFLDNGVYHLSAIQSAEQGGFDLRLEATKGYLVPKPDGGFEWVIREEINCVRYEPDDRALQVESELLPQGDATCYDAMAGVYDGDGEWLGRQLSWRGAIDDDGSYLTSSFAGHVRMDGVSKIYGVPADAGWGWTDALGEFAHLQDLPDYMFSWEHAVGSPFDTLLGDGLKRALLPQDIDSERFGLGVTGGWQSVIWPGARFDPEQSGIQGGDQLQFARFENRVMKDAGPAWRLGGSLSSLLSPENRRFFAVTFDGRIDELLFDVNGPRQRPVADLALPQHHFLAGAVDMGDELLAFTVRLPHPDERFGPDGRPLQGDVYAWTAASPDLAPFAQVPATEALFYHVSEQDMEICWPSGLTASEKDDWTLGGSPAALIPTRDDGSCALVQRDLHYATPLDEAGAFVAEGTVPGMGRVAIGTRHPLEHGDPFQRKVLDGTSIREFHYAMNGNQIVTPARIYNRVGTIHGALSFPAGDPMGWAEELFMYPDLAGGGLWREVWDHQLCEEDDMLGCTAIDFTQWTDGPKGYNRHGDNYLTTVGRAWGGGVLVRWHEEQPYEPTSNWIHSHLYPDGTFVDLPDIGGASSKWAVVMKNEITCRFESSVRDLFCESTDGYEWREEVTLSSGELFLPVSENTFYGCGGVTVATANITDLPIQGIYSQCMRVNVDERSMEAVLPSEVLGAPVANEYFPVTQVQYDADARLYGLVTWRDGGIITDWDLIRFDPEEIIVLNVDAFRDIFAEGEAPDLLPPTDDFFLLAGAKWREQASSWGVVRIPRDEVE